MLKAKILVGIGIAGMLATLVSATPAMAWHPKGVIIKKVQNITAGSELVDANTVNEAVEAKPGDILRYVITISNIAAAADQQGNDLVIASMDDMLPAGVELVDTPKVRTISEKSLGVVVPQKSITKEYQLKVTSTTDGDVITNTACFKGDSIKNDNHQEGCDDAVIKVSVPPTPPEEPPVVPEPPKTPEAPKTPETPTVIPKTGAETALLSGGIGLTSLGYAGYSAFRSRRELIRKMLKR
jgi:hypothetical protein